MLPRLDNSPFARLALFDGPNELVKRPSVRRNLFGTPSPEKQESDFLKQESRLADEEAQQRFIEKWGYDTSKGIPVENHKFEWIKVEQEDIPRFYLKTYAPNKSRPVHGSRRERSHSHNAPYPSRPSKRGCPRTSDDENNFFSGIHVLDKKVTVADSESMLTTPKAPRLDSPSSSLNVDLAPSSSGGDCCSCSNSSVGYKSDRSRSVSNKSSSPGLINVSTGSSTKQLTIKDLFQVKKSCSLNSFQRK